VRCNPHLWANSSCDQPLCSLSERIALPNDLRLSATCSFQWDAELAKQLKIDPKHITAVLNAFSRINRRGSETEMVKEYKRQQEQQRLAASQEKVVGGVPAGLSDEGRKQIEGAYNL